VAHGGSEDRQIVVRNTRRLVAEVVRLQQARPAQTPDFEVKLSREGAKERARIFCLLRVSAPLRESIFRNIAIT
jgi:hypothetical protein